MTTLRELWNCPEDTANLWINRIMFVIGPAIGIGGLIVLAVCWVMS